MKRPLRALWVGPWGPHAFYSPLEAHGVHNLTKWALGACAEHARSMRVLTGPPWTGLLEPGRSGVPTRSDRQATVVLPPQLLPTTSRGSFASYNKNKCTISIYYIICMRVSFLQHARAARGATTTNAPSLFTPI